MFILKLKKGILILASVSLALLPVFSVSAQAQVQATTIATWHAYTIKLKEKAQKVFATDKNISYVSVFQNSQDNLFANVYKINTTYSLQQLQNLYGNQIVYVDPLETVKAGSVSVNDPGFSTDPTNANRQWGLLKAKFPDAWATSRGSVTTVVAIIDTGIDATHEDLSAGQVGDGYNFITRTNITLGQDSDDNGHGTLVAGVIGATSNNFRGISGTNWNITLMPLKALDSTGAGNSADIAAAIVWAADNGANIINMSLGGIGFANDTTLSNAISYAYKKNVVLIAAAGNDVAVDGGNLDTNPVFPICDDNGSNMIIGVAATDINDQKTSFSNYGKACVDISAPGKHILSTINYDPTTHQPAPNGYAYASGTSLAVPFVSGEAALIKSFYPKATNIEIRDRIIRSADSVDNLNMTQCSNGSCVGFIGSGRINVLKALDPNLLPKTLADGIIARLENTNIFYFISGGQKFPVSQFVLNQRFISATLVSAPAYILDNYPTSSIYAFPNDGTIVKAADDNTVYETLAGFKRPFTYQVFVQRNIRPSDVNIISDAEINSWITGTFLPPTEGTLVRGVHNPTVYWVVGELLHPINYGFWRDRGLSIFPIMIVPDSDFKNYAKGEAYIR